MVAFSTLAPRPGNGCYIERLETLPSRRHQGLASGLVETLQSKFDEINLILSPRAGQSNSYLFKMLNRLHFTTDNGAIYWWSK